jgi:hypothetical protein
MFEATDKRKRTHRGSEENYTKLMHDNSEPSVSSLTAHYQNLHQEICKALKYQQRRTDEILVYSPLQGGDYCSRSIVVCQLAKSTSDPQYIHHGGLPVSHVPLANPLSPNHQGVKKSEPAILARHTKRFDSNVPSVCARSESSITGRT